MYKIRSIEENHIYHGDKCFQHIADWKGWINGAITPVYPIFYSSSVYGIHYQCGTKYGVYNFTLAD